jgi:hypothetical protein
MLVKGDLVWLPQKTVLLIPRPNDPKAFRITEKPEVGILVGQVDEDKDFYRVICDGREWVTNKKFIKHLRKKHVSEIS